MHIQIISQALESLQFYAADILKLTDKKELFVIEHNGRSSLYVVVFDVVHVVQFVVILCSPGIKGTTTRHERVIIRPKFFLAGYPWRI